MEENRSVKSAAISEAKIIEILKKNTENIKTIKIKILNLNNFFTGEKIDENEKTEASCMLEEVKNQNFELEEILKKIINIEQILY